MREVNLRDKVKENQKKKKQQATIAINYLRGDLTLTEIRKLLKMKDTAAVYRIVALGAKKAFEDGIIIELEG